MRAAMEDDTGRVTDGRRSADRAVPRAWGRMPRLFWSCIACMLASEARALREDSVPEMEATSKRSGVAAEDSFQTCTEPLLDKDTNMRELEPQKEQSETGSEMSRVALRELEEASHTVRLLSMLPDSNERPS
jgi:hypothetical protein